MENNNTERFTYKETKPNCFSLKYVESACFQEKCSLIVDVSAQKDYSSFSVI